MVSFYVKLLEESRKVISFFSDVIQPVLTTGSEFEVKREPLPISLLLAFVLNPGSNADKKNGDGFFEVAVHEGIC